MTLCTRERKKKRKKKACHMQIAYDIANTGTESHPERSMTAVNNIIIEEKNPKTTVTVERSKQIKQNKRDIHY